MKFVFLMLRFNSQELFIFNFEIRFFIVLKNLWFMIDFVRVVQWHKSKENVEAIDAIMSECLPVD